MRVPYNYLPLQFGETSAIFKDWESLIRTSEFTLGPVMEAFERKFADYVGVKHCVATNNGTDALILAYKSLGLGPGDEVITVCNTFYATVGAIVAVGATPIFVDCDDRYQIDVTKLEDVISERTRAIVPVHWAGASPDMKSIMSIASRWDIPVIEDACMGIGGDIAGKSPGTFGRVNAVSMHPLKSLNVMGDGGMALTNDDALATWMRKYRNHGMVDRDHIEFWGVNMRLQPLQAVVASHGLDTLPDIIRKRNENAAYFDSRLSSLFPKVKVPRRMPDHTETFALYMVLAEQRDALLEFLVDRGIEAKIHYPIPLHLQEAAIGLGYKKGSFPVSESQAKQILTLPIHQFVTVEQINYMSEIISEFYLG